MNGKKIESDILKIFFILIGVILFGTVSYHFIEGWDIFDCLYMTVITITTTGYKEVGEMSVYGKILSMFLMFFGVGIFMYAINTFVPHIVERSEKRWEKMLKDISDHYIVCGYGVMGKEIAKELPKDKVVVVDIDINKVELARENGYIAIHGDATDDVILEKAGIKRAKAIICCMTDASNAFALLTARELNPNVFTIAVLRSPDAEKKLKRIGVHALLSPYRDTARKVFALLTRKASVEFIETIISGREEICLEKVIIENDKLDGKTLRELDLRRRTGCTVVAIVRNGEIILPDADTELKRGDILYLIGKGSGIKALDGFIS